MVGQTKDSYLPPSKLSFGVRTEAICKIEMHWCLLTSFKQQAWLKTNYFRAKHYQYLQNVCNFMTMM